MATKTKTTNPTRTTEPNLDPEKFYNPEKLCPSQRKDGERYSRP